MLIGRDQKMKENDCVKKDKHAWTKPLLTILVRNNPEENVLAACKMRGVVTGPGSVAVSCSNEPTTATCIGCNTLSTS